MPLPDHSVTMTHPERSRPARRLIADVGNRANLVFVTVVTKDRKKILASPDIHELLRRVWNDVSQWMVGRYVIMPDHVHLFCAPASPESVNVRDWIAYWKSVTARSWPRREESPVWQREAWDRQVRRGESYGAKWDYVRQNPVRHQLVSTPEEWPFQGEMNVLPWHDV
jgi:REP element-mobilizing transposase RayT